MVTKSSKRAKRSGSKSKAERGEPTANRPTAIKSEFEEPLSKEDGTPFDATTAPRTAADPAVDVSQDLQDQATSAPRRRPGETSTTSGTA